jgi:signal transduction histidine kinase
MAPVRLSPLLVNAAYLGVLHGPAPTSARDWVFGMTVAALSGLAGWSPFAVTVAQSVLLVIGLHTGDARTAMPMMFLFTMITLGELWIRRSGTRCWAGAGAFVAAQAVLYAPHYDLVLSTSSIVVTTLPPVLLGLYVRSVLRIAFTAERRRSDDVRQARVAERTAIARELHDLVAHHMASIAVQVGAARHALSGADPRVDTALAEAHATTRDALTDLKRLMTVLRDPAAVSDEPGAAMVEPEGLLTAVAAAVSRARAAGVRVDADIDESVVALDSIRRLAVLRVVQEGLANVVKHAGPRAHAELTVRVHTETTLISIVDNGHGEHADRRRGFGIVGMRERAELLGGSVHTSDRSPGWSLDVSIPVGSDVL